MSRQPIPGAGAAVRSPSGAAARTPAPSPSSPLPPQRYRALRARYNALLVTLYERSALTLREIAAVAGCTDRAVQMLVRALGCRPRNAKKCRPGTDVGLRRAGARPPPLNAPAMRRAVAAFAGVARELAAVDRGAGGLRFATRHRARPAAHRAHADPRDGERGAGALVISPPCSRTRRRRGMRSRAAARARPGILARAKPPRRRSGARGRRCGTRSNVRAANRRRGCTRRTRRPAGPRPRPLRRRRPMPMPTAASMRLRSAARRASAAAAHPRFVMAPAALAARSPLRASRRGLEPRVHRFARELDRRVTAELRRRRPLGASAAMTLRRDLTRFERLR